MNREQSQAFIKDCRSYMLEQLQKEVVYYLRDNEVLTEAEFKDIIDLPKREHQIVLLLDILPSKQVHQLNVFIQYISDWYVWIIHNFRRKSQIEDYAEQEKEKMLDLGEVPPLPNRYVKRKEQYATLCKLLHELKRNEYIVVHGMRGCGKSTLVVDVLRHSYTLALETFKQKVFWLTVGRESCIDELTIQQELCSKIMFNRGYGLQIPLDSKSAKQFLREKLTNAELEDCLLILDDVSSSSIIQALDVGCRILVTTDDRTIMNRTMKTVHSMKVSEGFTEDETLSLFSKSIDSKNLPKEAKLIYSICKGFPLTISLISSQLEEHKEEVQHNTSRWNLYVTQLSQKNMERAFGQYDYDRQEQLKSLYKAIGMSIDSLQPKLKAFYQDFALFMDDVNIKVEVLATLWDMEETSVHDIMSAFERKCLVIRAWNHARECYIYCVHDLLLDYLKKKISSEEKEALHRKLIEKYQTRFGCDVTNFPISDNYIFLYLGHHLMEANLLDYFPRVFLDLRFIDKKITNFGAADLLLDFRKYQKYIACDATSTKRYEEVLHFIKHIGACKTSSNSNIVQFGLCEHKDSYVYKMASAMARGDKYFEILTDIPKEKSAPTVHYGLEEIVTAVFASDENILVANSTGTIKLVNIPQNRTLISFREHEKKVTLLQLTKNLVYFLSASDDCTIRIWYLNDYSSLEKNLSEKARTPSPQLRQTGWIDPFPNQRHSGEHSVFLLDKHQLPIKHAQWSNVGTLIVSTGEDLQTILWRLTLERDLKKKDLTYVLSLIGHEVIETKKKFESVAFSNDDTMILCAVREGQVFLYNSDTGAQYTFVDVGREIESMNVVPGNPHIVFFVLHRNFFQLWEILPTAGSGDGINKHLRYATAERKREDPYVCSAVSWDGAYVAMATKNQNICIHDLSTNKKISKFAESSGKICSLSWSPQNTALMTTYGSELLKIWHFSKAGVLDSAAKLCSLSFDAQWIWDYDDEEPCSDRPFVTAALDFDKKIRVFYDLQEKETLSAPSKAEILQCCVSPFDGNIFYACCDGSVYLVPLESMKATQIMNVSCVKLLKLKVFTLASKVLVLVLAETAPGKKSLIGCKKRKGTDFLFDMMTYVADSERIFDFAADLKTDSVHVVFDNHVLKTYSYHTAAEKFKEGTELIDCMGNLEFCDISTDFSHIVTGNENLGLLRSIGGAKKMLMLFENEVKVFKFSADGTMLAVGFSNGRFNIYETAGSSKIHSVDPLKFAAEVKDFIWCADNSRLLVIFSGEKNREMILYSISDKVSAESILFMSVDKVVCNYSFTKCVTIDSDGQFLVLKFPRS